MDTSLSYSFHSRTELLNIGLQASSGQQAQESSAQPGGGICVAAAASLQKVMRRVQELLDASSNAEVSRSHALRPPLQQFPLLKQG